MELTTYYKDGYLTVEMTQENAGNETGFNQNFGMDVSVRFKSKTKRSITLPFEFPKENEPVYNYNVAVDGLARFFGIHINEMQRVVNEVEPK